MAKAAGAEAIFMMGKDLLGTARSLVEARLAPLADAAWTSRFNGKALTAETFDGVPFDSLLEAPREVLDEYYGKGTCELPKGGDLDGVLAMRTGRIGNQALAMGLRYVWYGKYFEHDADQLFNNLFGKKCLKSSLYLGPSYFDGSESIIADYGTVRLPMVKLPIVDSLGMKARNEFRQVGPELYLGRTYFEVRGRKFFGVDFLLIDG